MILLTIAIQASAAERRRMLVDEAAFERRLRQAFPPPPRFAPIARLVAAVARIAGSNRQPRPVPATTPAPPPKPGSPGDRTGQTTGPGGSRQDPWRRAADGQPALAVSALGSATDRALVG